MTPTEQKAAAKAFAQAWKGRGDEKQETQKFWIELLHDVFGIASPTGVIEFEKKVKLEGSTKYIDAYIPDTRVIIEQKSLGIDLSKEGSQSGGDSLTPYNQARRYDNNLSVDEKARWIICCNFESFEIHDMKSPLAAPTVVYLKDLEKEYKKLEMIADIKVSAIRREEEISFKAGALVGELYEMILPQYADPSSPESLRSLNQLCVRLVFCLYAEDTGLFGEKDKFYKYLSDFTPGQFRKALIELFKVFDTPYEERDKYMDPELASFPYIKGGIFTDNIEIPLFTEEIKDKILNKASIGIDWSGISPTIFGAVFESTLNPETRRKGGMHYTSVENIHKVIDPLFLDDLRKELDELLAIPVKGKRDKALTEYQDKLASLKFLDPACGSGNFLTETYLSIRRLENRVLEALGVEGLLYLGDDFSPIKVKIDQFYGIEINDFAVSVARTALWIAEAQTLKETEHIVGKPIEYFPLKENPNIVEANALRIDWNDVIPASELNYIIGNPPFVGKKEQNQEQKKDLLSLFDNQKGFGNLDYVCGWYKKAVHFIQDTRVNAAFVSTNSITQGEQVPVLWPNLFKDGLVINFAWKTFRWDSEAQAKAKVHCVIIGFCCGQSTANKQIFLENGNVVTAANINPYLVDAPSVFIQSRPKAISGTLPIMYGSMPIDDGHLFIDRNEVESIVASNPSLSCCFKKCVGGEELIHNIDRWCLWLKDISPKVYNSSSAIINHISETKAFRLSSSRPQTLALADVPYLFGEIRQPDTDMLVIPKVSSEKRRYIPVAYVKPETIVTGSALLIPSASLYSFGILCSSTHNSWMRVVAGRLETRYQYSGNIVYNNFPWPTPTDDQKAKIEQTAQGILDARALYPDCSLADLYDELTMPIELRKAHQANDKAVMEAYGFDKSMSESDIVAALFKMYQALTEK